MLRDLATQLAGRISADVVLEDDVIFVTLTNGNGYQVYLDGFEEEPDDPFEDTPLQHHDEPPAELTDHMHVLEAILYCLGQLPSADAIRGLTSDGDHKDCEAIFKLAGDPVVLKIRPE
jgi:hypothetical protein